MKYEVIYQEAMYLDPGKIVQAVFTAEDLTEAVKKICENTTSYVDADDVVYEEDFDDDSSQLTAEIALNELLENDDTDYDIILSLRNLTTNELYIHQDQFERQEWDE